MAALTLRRTAREHADAFELRELRNVATTSDQRRPWRADRPVPGLLCHAIAVHQWEKRLGDRWPPACRGGTVWSMSEPLRSGIGR